MKNLRIIIILLLLSISIFANGMNCKISKNIHHLTKYSSQELLMRGSDVQRNKSKLNSKMCIYQLSFQENDYNWNMLLVYNSGSQKGPFWFLPHDDENTAFDSAVYAIQKYGGGFLSVISKNNRYFNGQDPNRNFGETQNTVKTCNQQRQSAPLYSKYIFKVIDTFKKESIPYLSMHNNKNGWYGNGGTGGISILKTSSTVRSYQSGNVLTGRLKGIKDEDSLVYIAGTSMNPSPLKLKLLIDAGMHVKYEVVNKNNNDCSMSNYVVLNKGEDYYNIETEHGDSAAQKTMIDRLMGILNISSLP